MTITRFHQIIDFAVEREKEAVNFYAALRKSAKFDAHKTMLQEIENMEKGHILTLEKLRNRNMDHKMNKVVNNLKIGDYIVLDSEVTPDSYPNILLIAMKREELSHLLYLELAEKTATEDKEISDLFAVLSAEEAEHKLKFEKLYDEDVLKDN